MTLCDAPIGKKLVIEALNFKDKQLHQIMNMGFIIGLQLSISGTAPLGDPLLIIFDSMRIALRKVDAKKITVRLIQ